MESNVSNSKPIKNSKVCYWPYLECNRDLPLAIGSIETLVDVKSSLDVSIISVSAEGCLCPSIYTLRLFSRFLSQVAIDLSTTMYCRCQERCFNFFNQRIPS